MQQRRLGPGDVLDDYCPRERRITDHAIVAMINDNIKQTRCVVCDAEHEYKQGKIPAQRRKKASAGLFTQVLDGLQGPVRAPQRGQVAESVPPIEAPTGFDAPAEEVATLPMPNDSGSTGGFPVAVAAEIDIPQAVMASADSNDQTPEATPPVEEGPVRRPLIRATLPRPEGHPPPTRAIPEFTIRQPSNGRGRHGGRSHGGRGRGQHGHGVQGPMRFGRGGHGHGQGQGQRQHGPRHNGGGRRRGGKKR